ncbi:DUF2634 domain-containing protein [Rummeliibacillus sp. POC4]|uniref:DUF2634 domain-containing protein n=1 Tax=Rummeliibacillus sp. POC4 TaxID=2305899 RepID=UPI000E66B69D|nr:DUF2634 domain-containing protein [Rummeliibacillus sp. POC4]RIJ63598.1 DUF2634 domain-containing protein [Rummeliibacillus sp. POC4]
MAEVLYPTFDEPDLVADEEIETLSDIYARKFDHEGKKTIVTGSGRTINGTAIDAYRFWVIKCLLTERYQCAAYSTDFGIEFEAIMEADYDRDIAESEIKRSITEALLVDERTVDVLDFTFEWEGDSCHITFIVESIYSIDVVEVDRGGELSGRIRAA